MRQGSGGFEEWAAWGRPRSRGDDRPRERDPDDQPVFTTLAIGEDGDPEPIGWPGPPEVTTQAIGEEGDPYGDPWGT